MKRFPKINSIHFGFAMIGLCAICLCIVPFLLWIKLNIMAWYFIITGFLLIGVFGVIIVIEARQDCDDKPYYVRHLREDIPFDRENETAVIKKSICTGEMVACFQSKKDGSLKEVMVIRSDKDYEKFKNIYKLDEIKIIY